MDPFGFYILSNLEMYHKFYAIKHLKNKTTNPRINVLAYN